MKKRFIVTKRRGNVYGVFDRKTKLFASFGIYNAICKRCCIILNEKVDVADYSWSK